MSDLRRATYLLRDMNAAEGKQGQSANILLVDGNTEDAEAIVRELKKGRLINQVFTAREGEEALDLLFGAHSTAPHSGASDISLLLLDLNVSGLNAPDILRRIRSDEQTRHLPVIMLAASQEERGVMQSYKAGAQGCIVKPFSFDKFVEALRQLPLYWLLVQEPED